jgi:hypothetical protein
VAGKRVCYTLCYLIPGFVAEARYDIVSKTKCISPLDRRRNFIKNPLLLIVYDFIDAIVLKKSANCQR